MADMDESKPIAEQDDLGCQHYRRKCALIAPCCHKAYTCRLCHNDSESHEMNRHKVTEVKCLKCSVEQKVKNECQNCRIKFGNYFCAVCRLYDDVDKNQFHCDPCGICRIGGRENYFHCQRCDMCLGIQMQNSHKCVEKASRSNCPVCMDDLHTSRTPCHIPPCGHLIHLSCYQDMVKTGIYACPVCSQSMLEMVDYWKVLDDEINNTPMPEEYRDMQVQILCRDCHKESRCVFHVIGLKCQNCGSYNTCRAAEPETCGEQPASSAVLEENEVAGGAERNVEEDDQLDLD